MLRAPCTMAQCTHQTASQRGAKLFYSSLDPRNTSKLAKMCSGAPAKASVSVDQQMQLWTLSPRALAWLARQVAICHQICMQALLRAHPANRRARRSPRPRTLRRLPCTRPPATCSTGGCTRRQRRSTPTGCKRHRYEPPNERRPYNKRRTGRRRPHASPPRHGGVRPSRRPRTRRRWPPRWSPCLSQFCSRRHGRPGLRQRQSLRSQKPQR